jgi:undecaprenyl diphosphate synthase
VLLDPARLPRHVAIIMDGNGRWAKQRGYPRVRGHAAGVETARIIIRQARRLGIRFLTLYAFSEENWQRPPLEVRVLMALLRRYLRYELQEMQENQIAFNAIGNLSRLPPEVRTELLRTMEATRTGHGMVLTLALSYGGRNEIVAAAQQLAREVQKGSLEPDAITPERFSQALYTAALPDPDLLIRTSGEYRLSNFLLWQMAYAELYFTDTLWPDFREEEFLKALWDYQRRDRRFGLTQEQVESRASSKVSR